MTRDNLEQMRADAERYRYLCRYQGWPEDIEAALECGSKVVIDAAIDERISREAQDMGSGKEAKDD